MATAATKIIRVRVPSLRQNPLTEDSATTERSTDMSNKKEDSDSDAVLPVDSKGRIFDVPVWFFNFLKIMIPVIVMGCAVYFRFSNLEKDYEALKVQSESRYIERVNAIQSLKIDTMTRDNEHAKSVQAVKEEFTRKDAMHEQSLLELRVKHDALDNSIKDSLSRIENALIDVRKDVKEVSKRP